MSADPKTLTEYTKTNQNVSKTQPNYHGYTLYCSN